MPGDNCSILGCPVSRRAKYKGIGIYKVPSGDGKFETSWREKLVAVIIRNRVVDSALKERIASRKLHICQRHYRPDQISCHDTRSSVIPGEIPELNLPVKSFQSPPSTPRSSSIVAASKRLSYQSSTITSPPSVTVSHVYKSFVEFIKRVQLLNLPQGWNLSVTSSLVTVTFMDSTHMVPKFEIFVTEDLSFITRVFLWRLPAEHPIFRDNFQSFQNITLSNFISSLISFNICPGITIEDSSSIEQGFIHHVIPKIFSPSNIESSFPLFQTKFIRAESCHLLVSSEPLSCSSCLSLFKKETFTLKRKFSNLMEPSKLNAPIKATAPEKVKLTLQSYRIENKTLKSEIAKMKSLIDSNNVPVDKELNNDMQTIMSNANQDNVAPFMKFFWEEQQKYLQTNKNGIRYHPAVIRYCLSLASKSPSAYDDLRYDDKTKTGFLMLPSRRRLRDYKNYIRPERGFNPGVIKELADMVKDFSDQEKYCTILIDEMKVQEDLVWDKHTGDLIGYIDLGDKELNCAALQNSDVIASHILVFLLRSAVNPIKFAFANFATKNVTSLQLFPLFWKAVGILEDRCDLKVVAVVSDGASANRTFYRMHKKMSGTVIAGTDCVAYKTKNIHADDDRYICFLCDQPHVMKTSRNNLSHSAFGDSPRLLWNDGYYLVWEHISKLMHDDMNCGLQLCPKITINHINLTPYSRMNVRLATQVLSESVSTALLQFGDPNAKATAEYCSFLDKFFDCMNVRNSAEHILKRKPFLAPYRSVTDERFDWLKNTFLPYFAKWKESIQNRPGEFTPTDQARMFISWQTYESIQITTYSTIDLVKFLLTNGVSYVFTERFCQDAVENYFGRHRQAGRRNDNPNVQQFGYQDNAFRINKTYRPIKSGNSRDTSDSFSISTEPLPCRPRKSTKN
jgi:hypothetical protein